MMTKEWMGKQRKNTKRRGEHEWCLVVQQGELAPRTQEHPSQERVGTSMLTQCTLGFEVIHPYRVNHEE
jgi:hypothetical protein